MVISDGRIPFTYVKSRDFRGLVAPLFNLSVELSGWRGPFREVYSFLGTAKNAMKYEKLIGVNNITAEGRIISGQERGLHTFKAEINVALIPSHIELFFPVPESKRIPGVLTLVSATEVRREDLPLSPVYTLEGLYATLANQEVDSKLEILSRELSLSEEEKSVVRDFGEDFLPIALRTLENRYRKEISNQ